MNLCDYNTVNKVLAKHGFTFSKALGQNFLINPEVCPAMADSLNANDKTGVIEIGAGVGVLTKELCRVAGKVVTVELDKRLFPVLDETLTDCNNLSLIEGDIMKINLNELIKNEFPQMNTVKVCANLPYYITSPVLMMLLQSNAKIDEIVVMVQKEAAERFCAPVGSRECGAITVAANYFAKTEMLFEVGKESFMPSPKVDSAVMKLTLRKKKEINVENEKHFMAVVKAAFAQRRKTALNCLSNGLGISKPEIAKALATLGIDEKARPESFSMEDFANLSKLI